MEQFQIQNENYYAWTFQELNKIIVIRARGSVFFFKKTIRLLY